MGIYGIPDPSVKVSAPAAASLNLSGKRMVVVGGTSGIGRAIALLSAARGAAVTVVGRSFKDQGVANLTFIQKDLSLMTHAAELGRSLPPADVVVLTQGILPPKTREATPEGLEKDMAVSTLSRLVTLRELLPRLQPSSRVFVWGMPGNGAVPKTTRIDDLNSEKGYAGGFGWTHINTVAGTILSVCGVSRLPAPPAAPAPGRIVPFSHHHAPQHDVSHPAPPSYLFRQGNEAMVVHLAEIEKAKGPGKGVSIFGMNPGLVRRCQPGAENPTC